MALTWWSSLPLLLTSCWAEPDENFFDGKHASFFKNWITNSILFANALWLVLFNRRMIRYRPAFFSASTQTPFRCMVFYGTLISKVDVNTCIEFESWLWKNSGLCVRSQMAWHKAQLFFWPEFFQRSRPVVLNQRNYRWYQMETYDCLKMVRPKILIQCLSTFSCFGLS